MNGSTEPDTTSELSIKETISKSTTGDHSHQLRTLLSIKRFSVGLQDHRDQLTQIEHELSELSKNSSALIDVNADNEGGKKWKALLLKINSGALSINLLLTAANKKVEQKDRTDSTDLWRQIEELIKTLKESCKELEDLGFELLTENDQKNWKANVLNFQQSILPLFLSHAIAYKVELQMIEKYTPEELSKVTQAILNNIPDTFTFEEAEKYEREYLKAMDDLEKEFSQEKNLWDTFLDILAGGTHQTPAERVMLNRWMDGEKGEL